MEKLELVHDKIAELLSKRISEEDKLVRMLTDEIARKIKKGESKDMFIPLDEVDLEDVKKVKNLDLFNDKEIEFIEKSKKHHYNVYINKEKVKKFEREKLESERKKNKIIIENKYKETRFKLLITILMLFLLIGLLYKNYYLILKEGIIKKFAKEIEWYLKFETIKDKKEKKFVTFIRKTSTEIFTSRPFERPFYPKNIPPKIRQYLFYKKRSFKVELLLDPDWFSLSDKDRKLVIWFEERQKTIKDGQWFEERRKTVKDE